MLSMTGERTEIAARSRSLRITAAFDLSQYSRGAKSQGSTGGEEGLEIKA
jgi:hypothetical protein